MLPDLYSIYMYSFEYLGNSIPSGFPNEANISPASPSAYVKHRQEGIADDLSGGGSVANGVPPPEKSPTTPEQTQSRSDEPNRLMSKEIMKLLKSPNLDSKHTSRELAHLMKSRSHFSTNLDHDAGKIESHDPPFEMTDGQISRKADLSRLQSSVDKNQSDQPGGLTLSEILKVLHSRKLDPKHVARKVALLMKSRSHPFNNNDVKVGKTDSYDNLFERNDGGMSRTAATGTQMSSDEKQSDRPYGSDLSWLQSSIDKEQTDQPGGLTLSEILKVLHSRKLDPKHVARKVALIMKSRSHPVNNNDAKVGNDINQYRTKNGDSPLEPTTGRTPETSPTTGAAIHVTAPAASGRKNSVKIRPLNVNSPKWLLKSDIVLTGANVPVEKPEVVNVKTALPTKSNMVHKQSPTQNPKPKQPSSDEELDSEELNTDTEWASGESQEEESEESGDVMLSTLNTESGSGEPGVRSTHSDGEYINKGGVSERSSSQLTVPESASFESANEQVGPEDPTVLSAIPMEESPSPSQIPITAASLPEEDEEMSTESADVITETIEPRFASPTNQIPDPETIEHGGQTDYAHIKKRKAPKFQNDFPHEESKKKTKMSSSKEPFAMPVSDLRWTGMSVAHYGSHDDAPSKRKSKQKNKENKSGGISMVVTMLQVTFIMGGLLLVTMMAAFFVFAW